MAKQQPNLITLLNWVKPIARDAGSIILKIREAHEEHPRNLSQRNLKTKADIDADVFLSDRLQRIMPHYPIISEHTHIFASPGPKKRIWVFDSLDGTADYVHGENGYVTQGTLLEEGEPAFSWIYHPESSTLFYANKTASYMERAGQTPSLLYVSSREKNLRLVHSRNLKRKDVIVNDLLRSSRKTSMGSLGYKAAMIAMDQADCCVFGPHIEIKIWDIMPIVPIIERAGGKVTNLKGESFVYTGSLTFRYGILMSNGVMHEELLDRLQPSFRALL